VIAARRAEGGSVAVTVSVCQCVLCASPCGLHLSRGQTSRRVLRIFLGLAQAAAAEGRRPGDHQPALYGNLSCIYKDY